MVQRNLPAMGRLSRVLCGREYSGQSYAGKVIGEHSSALPEQSPMQGRSRDDSVLYGSV